MLHALTYNRIDYERSVIHIPPPPLKSCLERQPERLAVGALSKLPLELLQEVLECLDIRSFVVFRKLNTATRIATDSLLKYQIIQSHAPKILCTLLRTGTAPFYNILDIFTALTTHTCTVCGKFGSLLFVLSCSRCCFSCLRSSPCLRVIPALTARTCYGLVASSASWKRLPILRTIPGVYTTEERSRTKSRQLVLEAKVREIAVSVHGGVQQMSRKKKQLQIRRQDAYQSRLKLHPTNSERRRMPPTPQSLDLTEDEEVNRCMVATSMPFVDITTGSAQSGLSCKGCQVRLENTGMYAASAKQHATAIENRDRVYSEQEFLEHFKECNEAQEMWRLSDNGGKPVMETEFTRRGGV